MEMVVLKMLEGFMEKFAADRDVNIGANEASGDVVTGAMSADEDDDDDDAGTDGSNGGDRAHGDVPADEHVAADEAGNMTPAAADGDSNLNEAADVGDGAGDGVNDVARQFRATANHRS